MKRMRKKNKGLSLIELVVAVAISSIVMLMIATIVSSSLKSYTRESMNAKAQNTQQLVMSKLSDVLMESQTFVQNGNLVETSSRSAAGDTYVEKVGKSIYYDSTTKKLYLSSTPWDKITGDVKMYVLAEDVEAFEITFDVSENTYKETIKDKDTGVEETKTYLVEHPTVKVRMVVTSGKKKPVEYTQSVVLRNSISNAKIGSDEYIAKQD